MLLSHDPSWSQGKFTIARLKYRGGGDWYNDPSAISNLLKFIREETLIDAADDEVKINLLSEDLYAYPLLFMTGHGKIIFSNVEVERLRHFLTNGGFLYADDDYGMDSSFRNEMKKVFPDKEFIELPFSHEIYHSHYEFESGLPKIHEHDGEPPHGYGMFHEGRLVVFYTYSSNISDGWPESRVHGNPENVRIQALKMGVNIVVYVLNN
ncbi:DUF4159 domain-containing protein [candidate division KSB1 bacterium]|nr:DUF4159 domain-containing protein [candidate division KSB1 bacterium]